MPVQIVDGESKRVGVGYARQRDGLGQNGIIGTNAFDGARD